MFPILFLNTLFCSLFFLVPVTLSAIGTLGEGDMLFVPIGGWGVQRYILLKSFIVLSSWYCGYLGMKHLPLTLVGPINATRPVMVLLGALIIFGERLNLWQWAGVLLSVLSFFLLSRSGKKEGIDFRHNRWIAFVVVAAVLGALSGLYDKYLMAPAESGGVGLNRMTVQSYYNFYQCLMMGLVLLLTREWKCTSLPLLPIFLVSVFLSLVSVVSMVRRGSVVVSFLLGAYFFREKNLRSKAVDLALVLLGMLCLWLGSS